MLLAMPIALQEMVFAVWLITKGFAHDDRQIQPRQRPRVDAMA